MRYWSHTSLQCHRWIQTNILELIDSLTTCNLHFQALLNSKEQYKRTLCRLVLDNWQICQLWLLTLTHLEESLKLWDIQLLESVRHSVMINKYSWDAYIDQNCSHLWERILWQLCKNFIQASIKCLFNMIWLNVLTQIICNKRVINHFWNCLNLK